MNQTIHISIDAAELIDSLQWDVMRKDIGRDGARGVIGNDGAIVLRMNDHAVLTLFVHEDDRGKLVVDVHKGVGETIARVYPEDEGHVPARPSKKREPGS